MILRHSQRILNEEGLILCVHTYGGSREICIKEDEGILMGSAQDSPASVPGLWALVIVTVFNSWPGMGTDHLEWLPAMLLVQSPGQPFLCQAFIL